MPPSAWWVILIAFAALGSFVDTPERVWFGEATPWQPLSAVLHPLGGAPAGGPRRAAGGAVQSGGDPGQEKPAATAAVHPVRLLLVDPVTFAADRGQHPGGTGLRAGAQHHAHHPHSSPASKGAVLPARARNKRDVGTATVLGGAGAAALCAHLGAGARNIEPPGACGPAPSMAGPMAQMTGSWGKLAHQRRPHRVGARLLRELDPLLGRGCVQRGASRGLPAIFRRENRNGTPSFALAHQPDRCRAVLLLVGCLAGYTNLLLISTSMILVPHLLIGLFLLKLVFSGRVRAAARCGWWRWCRAVMVSWLLYAAGVEYLLLSLPALYGPGLLLFLYSRRQLGAEQRSAGANGCWPG